MQFTLVDFYKTVLADSFLFCYDHAKWICVNLLLYIPGIQPSRENLHPSVFREPLTLI